MKRYDQYRIDPREAGATDYKQRPEDPGEGNRQDDIFSRTMETDQAHKQPIAPDLPDPAAARDREAELDRERHVRQKRSRKHSARGRNARKRKRS